MKITLPQQSLSLLQQALSTQGWATTLQDIYIGGQILTEVLPILEIRVFDFPHGTKLEDISAEKIKEFQKLDEIWANKSVSFELNKKQEECIKKCLKETGKNLPINIFGFTFKLLNTFNVKE